MDEIRIVHDKLNPNGRRSPVYLEGFGRKDLAKLYRELGYRKGAEVGVAGAKHSKMMCEQIPELELLCVDPWKRYQGNPRGGQQEKQDRNYEIAKRVLRPFNATLIPAMSMDAVRDVEPKSLDFVYIDGHHGFDWVMPDIIEWSKRVRSGGIVAGHDYYHFRWAGVVEAVNVYVKTHGINEWFLTIEREPSWFWVKP